MTTPPLWLVTRAIELAADLRPSQAETLAALPGVQSVMPGKRRILVAYDVREIQYRALSAHLGLPKGSVIARLRQAWLNNMDRNLADSLLAKAGACCNQPPVRR